MPRGEHPNSRKNLIRNSERTPKQRHEQAVRAGKASGEARPANGVLRRAFLAGITEESAERIVDAHRRKAEHGNEASTKLIIKMLGEDQKEQLEMEKLRAEIRKLQAELEPQNDNDQVMEFIEALKKHAYPEPETD